MPRPLTPLRIAALAGALALMAAAIAIARGGRPVTPVSDTAVIESYTLYARQAQLLVGPYSRYGWHHPGPLYLYLLAPVYAVSGSSTPGLSAAALLINVASIAVLAWVLVRADAGWLALVLVASMTLYVWRVAPMLTSPWNPHVVVLPLAALVVVGGAVASGDVNLLPLAAGLASFVTQTHLGAAPTALGVFGIAALATWLTARDGSHRRRRALIGAAAVAAVLWAVPLVEQVSAAPGNMTLIARFFATPDRGHQTPAAAYAAWSDMVTGVMRPDFQLAFGSPLRRSRWPAARTIAAGEIVALAAVALLAHRRRRRFEAALAALLLIGLAIAFAAVTRIHDAIIDHEVFWISAVGAAAAAAIAAAALSAAVRFDPPWPLVSGAAFGACLTVSLVGLFQLNEITRQTFAPDAARRAAGVLGDAIERRVRSTGVRPLIHIDQDEWAVAAGVLLHLQRSGVPFAVEDDWLVMFTDHARATGTEKDAIAITGRSGRMALASRGGETIASADPFYAVTLTPTTP